MNKKYYSNLDETLFHTTLKNGLNVYIIVKKGFSEKSAYIGTKFGSLQTGDTLIDVDGSKHKVIGGIAHFLEHRLFDNKRGNVMDLYDKIGANCNAFTSFDKTVYYFSTTSNFEEGLELLLNYTSEFEMSEEAVNKEKDIIIQELKMYEDMPDRELFFQLLNSLYHNHPVKNEVGGEIEEVKQTTRKLLNLCHNTFYDPSNMSLVIVGDVDVEKTISLIKKNQSSKTYKPLNVIRKDIVEPLEIKKEHLELVMDVNADKIIVGYKLKPIDDLDIFSQKKVSLALEILGDILFSKSGEYYQELVEKELISDIGTEVIFLPGMLSLIVSAESSNVDKLEVRIKEIIKESLKALSEEKLKDQKKELISKMLYSCNTCSKIAYNFTTEIIDGFNYFEIYDVIKSIDLEYLNQVIKHYLLNSQSSVVIIKGK